MSRYRATAWIFADSRDSARDEAYYLNKGKAGISIVVDEDSIEYEDEEE